jgi:hypothetical protein
MLAPFVVGVNHNRIAGVCRMLLGLAVLEVA